MKLTHKAIARAAGYRVKSDYRAVSPLGRLADYRLMFSYYELEDVGNYTSWHDTEEAAYKACCEDNQLIEEE